MTGVAVALLVGIAVQALLFYPGLLSYDARLMIGQALSGMVNDHRSPLATVLYGAIARYGFSPYFLLAWPFAAVLIAAGLLLVRQKLRPSVLVLATLAVALSPGLLGTYAWISRDTAAAALLLLATALFSFGVPALLWLTVAAGAVAMRLDVLPATLPLLLWWAARPGTEGSRTKGRTTLTVLVFAAVLFFAQHAVNQWWIRPETQHPVHSVMRCDLVRMQHLQPSLFSLEFVPRCEPGADSLSEFTVLWRHELCMPKLFNGWPETRERWWQAIREYPIAYLRARAEVATRLAIGPAVWNEFPEWSLEQAPIFPDSSRSRPTPRPHWFYELGPVRAEANAFFRSPWLRYSARVGWPYLATALVVLVLVFRRKRRTDSDLLAAALSASALTHFAVLALMAPRAREPYLTWLMTATVSAAAIQGVAAWRSAALASWRERWLSIRSKRKSILSRSVRLTAIMSPKIPHK